MINQKNVTIIIPTLGRNEQQKRSLYECLTSLRQTEPEIKIITVWNGNDDFLPTWGEVYIKEQGQCKAVNAAIATTNTQWIMVTNDDMIYPPGWFNDLVSILEPNILCVSSRLIEPRPGAPTFGVYFCGGAGGDFDKKKWLEFSESYEGNGLRTGFNLPFLIRRDLWDTVGGYDINYDPWGSNSDSDLEYKIKLAGVQPYQNTNSIVYHFSQTSGTFEPKNDSYRFKNYSYFKEKWGFDRTDNGIWEASFEIPTKEQGRIFCPSWEGKYGES